LLNNINEPALNHSRPKRSAFRITERPKQAMQQEQSCNRPCEKD